MKRRCGVLIAVSCAVVVGGCAIVSGLDQLQEVACVVDCGAGNGQSDATEDDSRPADRHIVEADGDEAASAPPLADADGAAPDDQIATLADSIDGAASVFVEASGADRDAAEDTGDEAADCGGLGTPQNCSACGVSCAPASAAVLLSSCAGGRCNYACGPGYLDCNAGSGTNVDGCECAVPGAADAGCCATACPVAHNADLAAAGPSFFDCVPLGTYTRALALDACGAFFGDPALCSSGPRCNGGGDVGADLVICGDSAQAPSCACWVYAGPHVGHMIDPGSRTCRCPTSTSPTYQ